MPERWVAHVVGEAGGGHDGANLLKQGVSQFRVGGSELPGNIVAQRHPHARHLKAVCQAVVHENATWQREDLRLVLKTTKGGGENQTVAVALEFRAVVMALNVPVFLPQALVGYQLVPIHAL